MVADNQVETITITKIAPRGSVKNNNAYRYIAFTGKDPLPPCSYPLPGVSVPSELGGQYFDKIGTYFELKMLG